MSEQMQLTKEDLKILRELGDWQAAEAGSARNREKIDAWYAHDAGLPARRPMLLMEVGYGRPHWPVGDEDLRCSDAWARGVEFGMRHMKWLVDVLRDDHVVPDYIPYYPAIHRTDFGVGSAVRHKEGAGLAFHYEPVLKTLDDADFARLRHRSATYDRAATSVQRDRLDQVFGGILPTRLSDAPWQFCIPLTSTALSLIGLEGFMLMMYDNPAGLHRLMAFLRDDQLAYVDWLESEQAWPLNNGPDYVAAGSMGYTRDLPAAGFDGRVRALDRWVGSESQESVSISPAQYGEFVFPYLKAIMDRFGKVYYGCCEPVHAIWEYLASVPNLSRVSVSPWADEELVAKGCREKNIAYSRKPTPNILSGERFDEGAQREVLEKTVAVTSGCRLEIVQRDVYVTNGQPQRLVRWVELAREACSGWKVN
ncbi:MAG: hypothetical protein ABFD92_05685 [Planctomycetaceae bacterium]|nr:hypothetical protein [Planctomycetaceae bacterium]